MNNKDDDKTIPVDPDKSPVTMKSGSITGNENNFAVEFFSNGSNAVTVTIAAQLYYTDIINGKPVDVDVDIENKDQVDITLVDFNDPNLLKYSPSYGPIKPEDYDLFTSSSNWKKYEKSDGLYTRVISASRVAMLPIPRANILHKKTFYVTTTSISETIRLGVILTFKYKGDDPENEKPKRTYIVFSEKNTESFTAKTPLTLKLVKPIDYSNAPEKQVVVNTPGWQNVSNSIHWKRERDGTGATQEYNGVFSKNYITFTPAEYTSPNHTVLDDIKFLDVTLTSPPEDPQNLTFEGSPELLCAISPQISFAGSNDGGGGILIWRKTPALNTSSLAGFEFPGVTFTDVSYKYTIGQNADSSITVPAGTSAHLVGLVLWIPGGEFTLQKTLSPEGWNTGKNTPINASVIDSFGNSGHFFINFINKDGSGNPNVSLSKS
ncbi:hypothetical protein [Serratia sp. OS31]|uniref:hypothetical protein n=1 Tax=Serratia sp. OS31 TaxID=2760844 RepID=UPI00160441F4|nr:hypothetical protein [Serratia sp. OS31]MBB1585071.1 hypothetical protein [Serratia sp. OS31]